MLKSGGKKEKTKRKLKYAEVTNSPTFSDIKQWRLSCASIVFYPGPLWKRSFTRHSCQENQNHRASPLTTMTWCLSFLHSCITLIRLPWPNCAGWGMTIISFFQGKIFRQDVQNKFCFSWFPLLPLDGYVLSNGTVMEAMY